MFEFCVLIEMLPPTSNFRNIFTVAPYNETKDIDRCLIVRQASKIYDTLCDVVEKINFCFSFQVIRCQFYNFEVV